MKKQLFLMSALALTALTSCGGQGGGIKVGLICLHDKNSTYDANFIEAFESACEDAKKAGKISDYSYVTDVPESNECYDAAERFVNQGYNIIFSDSYGHDGWMRKAASEFPHVFFCSATGDQAKYAELPNFHNAFASIYEGRYLAGVAAGEYLKEHANDPKIGKNPKVGYVAAFPYAEVVSGYTSWFLGVRKIVPGATMQVEYTSSWYHMDREFSAAEKLINDGCVLISQHADSMGAPNACKQHSIPNVSYNMNTSEMDVTCKDTYVAHSRINWKPYYAEVLNTPIGSLVKGEKDLNWTGTLKLGSVEYNVTDNTNLISAAGKTEVETIKSQLEGGAHVFDVSTFKIPVDQQKEGEVECDEDGHLTKYIVDLNGGDPTDPEHIKKLENIIGKDGGITFVRESELRSAPSFALNIEGITRGEVPPEPENI